jgi:hypothetical protein
MRQDKPVMIIMGESTFKLVVTCTELLELMNNGKQFFEAETEQGDVLILNKDYVSMVSEVE